MALGRRRSTRERASEPPCQAWQRPRRLTVVPAPLRAVPTTREGSGSVLLVRLPTLFRSRFLERGGSRQFGAKVAGRLAGTVFGDGFHQPVEQVRSRLRGGRCPYRLQLRNDDDLGRSAIIARLDLRDLHGIGLGRDDR